MQLQGNDYAKVAERLRLFREECPNGKQESSYVETEQATIFTVWLWKNKSDLLELMKTGIADKDTLRSSADSNGTAKGEGKGKKDFEKLETIALGRALANLGYLASGEIASTEEMEDFMAYQENKKVEARMYALEQLNACTSLVELQETWKTLGTAIQDKEVLARKDELKLTLK